MSNVFNFVSVPSVDGEMSGAKALELVAELRQTNKTDVYELLEKYGITFNTRNRGAYEGHDQIILETLGNHPAGLNSKAIKFYLDQTDLVSLTTTQFHSRLTVLQKSEQVVLNKAMGTYGLTGK
jgi:hypothetical protein